MKTYRYLARTLETLLDGESCVQIHVEGYMPLVIEEIARWGDNRREVALSQTAVQDGDLMRDPEVVFAFDHAAAEPVVNLRPTTRAPTPSNRLLKPPSPRI